VKRRGRRSGTRLSLAALVVLGPLAARCSDIENGTLAPFPLCPSVSVSPAGSVVACTTASATAPPLGSAASAGINPVGVGPTGTSLGGTASAGITPVGTGAATSTAGAGTTGTGTSSGSGSGTGGF
jgi:hypothetical protein